MKTRFNAIVQLCALLTAGCTSESVRIAIESQQRADEVSDAVFQRQHDGLRVLLYRDLARQLAEADDGAAGALNDEQRAVLNAAWNERDLIEFWAVQHERARALRLIGVDARLYSEQSVFDLLFKQVNAKLDRGIEAAAGVAGKHAAQGVSSSE